MNSNYSKNVTVTILDVLGRTLSQTQMNAQLKTDIDASNLRNGTYFIRINDENQSKMVKIIKQ